MPGPSSCICPHLRLCCERLQLNMSCPLVAPTVVPCVPMSDLFNDLGTSKNAHIWEEKQLFRKQDHPPSTPFEMRSFLPFPSRMHPIFKKHETHSDFLMGFGFVCSTSETCRGFLL